MSSFSDISKAISEPIDSAQKELKRYDGGYSFDDTVFNSFDLGQVYYSITGKPLDVMQLKTMDQEEKRALLALKKVHDILD